MPRPRPGAPGRPGSSNDHARVAKHPPPMPPQTKAGFPRSPSREEGEEVLTLDDDAMSRVDDLLDEMIAAAQAPVNADPEPEPVVENPDDTPQ